jgi:hypothetical protein
LSRSWNNTQISTEVNCDQTSVSFVGMRIVGHRPQRSPSMDHQMAFRIPSCPFSCP